MFVNLMIKNGLNGKLIINTANIVRVEQEEDGSAFILINHGAEDFFTYNVESSYDDVKKLIKNSVEFTYVCTTQKFSMDASDIINVLLDAENNTNIVEYGTNNIHVVAETIEQVAAILESSEC